jgi:hypothetical protein
VVAAERKPGLDTAGALCRRLGYSHEERGCGTMPLPGPDVRTVACSEAAARWGNAQAVTGFESSSSSESPPAAGGQRIEGHHQ